MENHQQVDFYDSFLGGMGCKRFFYVFFASTEMAKIHILFHFYRNFFVWKVCVHLLHHSMVARQLQPSVVTMAQLVESLGTALRWAQALKTFEETGW